jgi:RND family efflux transporter MFP subunit
MIPVLPGQTEAYTDAPIYAQTSGYLNKWYFDIGAKVKAGDVLAEIDTPEVDRMQQTSPLRVYVSVPQAFADLVKIGTEGDLTLDEFPGRRFLGHVTNTARAIDPTSRTLLTELQVPNETGELFPGAYALITLRVNDNTGILTIPSNALLFRSEGTTVGVVDADGQVEIHKITISLNLGDKLQVSQGLSETDQVIVNPSDSLVNGMTVKILNQKQISKE